MEELNLKVSSSPHVRSKDSTSDIMFDVILALVPATVFGIYQFGWYAGLLVAVCIATSVLAEFIYEKGMKKKITVSDFSAVLTGLLIALNLPPELPVWMAMLGCVFAIIVVKQLFGGLGQNFMNPALGARCFLLLAFSRYMTKFVYDGVATATPLATLKAGGKVDIMDMFIGRTAGTIGEVSAAALLVGGLYLLIKRIISPRIPLFYIGTFAICIVIYAVVKDKDVLDFTLAHLCGGGLMLGAWFMATDYVTSPITPNGKIIFGIMLGLLTFVLRIFGASAEGVSYAIIISNLFVPLIERVTVPKAFGEGAELKGKENKKAEKAAKDTENADVKDTVVEEKLTEDAAFEKEAKQKMDVKGIFKAVVALFIITAIMGAGLGIAYNITKKPIEKVNEKAKQDAYKEVFPDAETVDMLGEEVDYDIVNEVLKGAGYKSDKLEEIGVASKGGVPAGFILVMTNSDGYGGDIKMVVGVKLDGSISGLSFLEINETAGLGMQANTDEFKKQFINKQGLFKYTKTGAMDPREIDALSGATITTSAVVEGVNACYVVCDFLFGNGGGN